MAKVVIEKWQCDRCKELYDKRPRYQDTRVSAVFTVDEAWSGYTLEWKELCVDCNNEVKAAIDALRIK